MSPTRNTVVSFSKRNGLLIDTIHPVYHVTFLTCFMQMARPLYRCYLPPYRCCASHSFSLSLSISSVVSALPLFLRHTQKCLCTFSESSLIVIKSFDKHHCFTVKAVNNNITLNMILINLFRPIPRDGLNVKTT
jgi:hypothetical protein